MADLNPRAREYADRFTTEQHPEASALGMFAAMTAEAALHINRWSRASRDSSFTGLVMADSARNAAVLLAQEIDDALNGWHAAADELAARRAVDNSVAAVAWPQRAGV